MTELPTALVSDIRILNRRYLLLVRELARISTDYAVLMAGVPARAIEALTQLSIEEIDQVCEAAGPVLLLHARFDARTWQEVIHNTGADGIPYAALAACREALS